MTDLRNLTIIGLIGRLNALIDERGIGGIWPEQVIEAIMDGTLLSRLRAAYGAFPEFAPIDPAEAVLLLMELKSAVEKYRGREESKMGVRNNGECLLIGYCVEMLMERNVRELQR